MKRIIQFLLASSLVFGVSTIANAQPPEQAPLSVPQPEKLTPEDTINRFFDAWNNGEIAYISYLVDNTTNQVQSNTDDLNKVSKMVNESIWHFTFHPKNIKISIDPQNSNLATATYQLGFSNYELGLELRVDDKVQLKHNVIPTNNATEEYWSIIPGDPQDYLTSSLNDNSAQESVGFTKRLATMIAYPQKMLAITYLQQSKMQLKQIGLSLFMFAQDYDERIDLTQEDFKKRLTPYIKNISSFTAPDDPPETTSFNINPNIVGLSLSTFTDFEDTVAFYLGHDQKLDFRYDGMSVVCFMDGHVEAISPEQAKELQWKP